MKTQRNTASDIAIVGISCMAPEARDYTEFWNNVLDGVSSIKDVPAYRWDPERFYSGDKHERDKTYSAKGGFIPPIPFDPVSYGMPIDQVRATEPLQLLMLEAVRSVIDDAGYTDRPFNRDRTAVIIGTGSGLGDHAHRYIFRTYLPHYFDGEMPEELMSQLPKWSKDAFPGIAPSLTSGRISNRFGFGGPNFTVDAACSSGLTSVYLGIRELRAGACDVVIAGGADTYNHPFFYICFSRVQALSASGTCKVFADDADGMLLGEAVSAVMLKRIEDAERDGDRIYAIIKGVASASDGRAKALTAPSAEGQIRAMERTYESAGVSPATIGLIEAHGTATKVGDDTEIESLTRVFSTAGAALRSIPIGSVKSMIGHTKMASGLVGLIKASLSLYHAVLPPTINIDRPNPQLKTTPFYPNTRTRPWMHGGAGHPRRAAVSSFGFGGTNFHAVLEEYEGPGQDAGRIPRRRLPCELFLFRDSSRNDLLSRLRAFGAALPGAVEVDLSRLSREAWRESAERTGPAVSIVADTAADLELKVSKAIGMVEGGRATQDGRREGVYYYPEAGAPAAGSVAFLFPGQGVQSPDMLEELCCYFSEIRKSFEAADRVLRNRKPEGISGYVYPPPAFSEEEKKDASATLARTDIAQPALAAASMGVLHLLQSFGISPAYAAGHSFGEYSALCAAGVFDEETFYRLAEARGAVIKKRASDIEGAMAAVSADAAAVGGAMAGIANIWVSNRNSPGQTVVSGSRESIDEAVRVLGKSGIEVTPLAVSCAFHSPLVAPAGEEFGGVLETLRFETPRIPVFSNVTGKPYPSDPALIAGLLREHLVKPVDFVGEIGELYSAGARIFVECGPRAVTTKLAAAVLERKNVHTIAIDSPQPGGVRGLLHAIGRMAALNVPVNLDRLFNRMFDGPPRPAADERAKGPVRRETAWFVDGGSAWPASNDNDDPGAGRRPVTRVALRPRPEMSDPAPHAGVEDGPAGRRSRSAEIGNLLEVQRKLIDEIISLQEITNRMIAGVSDGVPGLPPLESDGSLSSIVAPAYTAPAASSGSAAEAAPPARDTAASAVSVIVAERTGYPADLIDQDALMEADLGIDSLKKTEIIGAVRKQFATLAPDRVPALAAAKTLREFIGIVETAVAGASPAPAAAADSAAPVVLSVVAERTGYPADLIDPDAQLEADLGIDSLKKTEIIGAVRKQFATLAPDRVPALAAAKTLREFIGIVETAVAGASPAPAAAAGTASGQTNTAPKGPYRFRMETVAIAPPLRSGKFPRGARILITSSGDGLTEELSRKILGEGAEPVVLLHSGLSAGPSETGNVRRVDFADFAAVEAAVGESCGDALAGVIHAAPLRPSPRLDTMSFAEWRERIAVDIKGMFNCSRAAFPFLHGMRDKGANPFFIGLASDILYNNNNGNDAPASGPWNGGIAGFISSLAKEWPDIVCKTIDVGCCRENERADVVWAEMAANDGYAVVGYGSGGRAAPRLLSIPLPATSTDRVTIDSESVIILTGGARGITSEIAIELARRFRPKLFLAGRSRFLEAESPETAEISSKPELIRVVRARAIKQGKQPAPRDLDRECEAIFAGREIAATVAAIRDAGARVRYAAFDLGTEDGVKGLFDAALREYGRVDGVIHGAGIKEDALIANKDPASFSRVVDTKADSAFLLSRAMAAHRVRFAVFFSSMARLGSRGQADYAAANGIVASIAEQCAGCAPERFVAIDWAPWSEKGMAAKMDPAAFLSQGVGMIAPADGRTWCIDELLRGAPDERSVLLGELSIDRERI